MEAVFGIVIIGLVMLTVLLFFTMRRRFLHRFDREDVPAREVAKRFDIRASHQEDTSTIAAGQADDATEEARGSPARLGVAYISQRAGDDQGGESNGGPEYAHEYITASTVRQSRFAGFGTPKEEATRYPAGAVEDHINGRASLGWALIDMEPDWYWERIVISGAMSITKPLAIVGWYLTFSRNLARKSVEGRV